MIDFEKAHESFIDSEENPYYVALERSRYVMSKLENAIANPFKIILLHAEPGLGKSYLLQQFYEEHQKNIPLFLYKSPTFTDANALYQIYEYYYDKAPSKEIHQTELIELIEEKSKRPNIIILDEAQLYDNQTLEWIRLLSNRNDFAFIFAIHKVDNEHILTRSHFQSRIFTSLTLEPLTLNETLFYLEKKFQLSDNYELYSYFTKRNLKRIFKYTKGNIRDINRLMYTLIAVLEIELNDSSEHISPFSFFSSKIKNRYIDASAFSLGKLS